MRYITTQVLADLERKMVFIGGPRQCGKTTLAKDLLNQVENFPGTYFNWDKTTQKQQILKNELPVAPAFFVFDEIHKYSKWKNLVKGLFDTLHPGIRFLITGSARLDIYRRGGDSLLGRYHYWRLHPFNWDEVPTQLRNEEVTKRLLNLGGFPEPFLLGDETFARRWRRDRLQRLVREDVRDLEGVKDLSTLELFVEMLRSRVGSEIVFSNIAQDLQVAPKTLVSWLEVLERLYIVFVVRPYSQNLMRTIQKAPKVYFFDTGDVEGDQGAKFENQLACQLLKRIHFLEDSTGYAYKLYYLRDKEKRELDFLVTKEKKVELLLEAKTSDDNITTSMRYYAEKIKPSNSVQVLLSPKQSYSSRGILVQSVYEFVQNKCYLN